MPAIRDSSWSTTTVATGLTLAIPTPTSLANDLLIAVIVSDIGAGAWTSAGWTHVPGSPFLNTSQLVVMWKLAAATEVASYTFTAATASSYNGAITSILDVNTTSPFGTTPVVSFVAQAAAAKFFMPTITTTVANSLILYATGNNNLGVPSLLEGPATGLVAADGSAESLGIGWGFQAATGLTSGAVGASNVITGVGGKMALQIAPPATGATVIPAYCAADLSVYVDPLNGVSAYNANTAIAATADTNFGTALGGFTAADATVAAIGDVGINSFHSAARLTTATGTSTLAGAELVLAVANRPNVTGKNLLVHVGPATEGQLQRFSSIASGRGMWFGMRSGAAANYKIWQVYGAELGSLRHQPVVINSNAINTRVTNGTLDPAIILSFGFWISGTGVTTTAWDFAALWVLDTTTVCGGNLAGPLDISGIVAAAATGKERKSVLRQGAGQALSYQPLQIGNGGVNPTFLLLDSTALEFPGQYNAAAKQVTYNSVDNVAGITYHAGAADTIKHRDSVVSSPSRYHWRIHPSSSASASYDFNGLALIGAGDVVLRNVTTFAGMNFVNCALITQNSAPISGGVLRNSRVLSNLPSAISGCSFTSTGTGHAIEITTPGTYTFSANSFAAYAASGSTGNEAIFNNSGGAVVLNIAGGGSTPSIRNGTAATTTVNNTIVLTLTGLVTGSDVVILQAGTATILVAVDQNVGTTYPYAYSTQQSVDIGILKPGHVPLYVRGYPLGAANASIPISQTVDRNYS